ncbi:hypothetical protein Pmani_025598 [Petrolisthes manimaculis]|uniref:Uncharacterized protein n=2 Tax=Petrolisthes manimaculis TaxID=1843537 RepID=A0AAE1TXI2_9EUCA|nr:hypothetical protein Pmani_025598 [Petrolisthes manimaculis]
MTGERGGGDRPPADPPDRTLLLSSGIELSSMPQCLTLLSTPHTVQKDQQNFTQVSLVTTTTRNDKQYYRAELQPWAHGRRGRQVAERVSGGRAGRASVGGAVVRRGRAVVTECRSPISRCAHPHRDTHTRNTNTTFNKMCKRNMRVRAMCASVCVQGGDGTSLVVTARTNPPIGGSQGGRSREAAPRFVSFQNLSKCFAFCARSAILHTPPTGAAGGA